MPRMVRRLLLLASMLGLVAPAAALTAGDCDLWLQQLRGETGRVPITGDDGAEQRRRLLGRLDEASRPGGQRERSDSAAKVARFQEEAKALAAQGKVSPVEGERLFNIAETARRCLERVRQQE